MTFFYNSTLISQLVFLIFIINNLKETLLSHMGMVLLEHLQLPSFLSILNMNFDSNELLHLRINSETRKIFGPGKKNLHVHVYYCR